MILCLRILTGDMINLYGDIFYRTAFATFFRVYSRILYFLKRTII
nr:MAG TPA: hypothetical protein [Caudoviricetes sp.]